jgi:hypothetical protein
VTDDGRLSTDDETVFLWLRRRFIAGFFVAVPLIISVAARFMARMTTSFGERVRL